MVVYLFPTPLRQKKFITKRVSNEFFLRECFFSFIQIVLNKTKKFKDPNYSIQRPLIHYLAHQLIWP